MLGFDLMGTAAAALATGLNAVSSLMKVQVLGASTEHASFADDLARARLDGEPVGTKGDEVEGA